MRLNYWYALLHTASLHFSLSVFEAFYDTKPSAKVYFHYLCNSSLRLDNDII